MDTSHCLGRRGFILLIVLFNFCVFSLASKMDVFDDARGTKINHKRFLSNSSRSKFGKSPHPGKEYTTCTNPEPSPGLIARISCDAYEPGYVITKIDFADYGNPSGTCGHFRHGNCGAPATLRLVKKNCLGKMKCTLFVTDEMFGPSHCKEAPMIAIQSTCTKV